MQNTTQGKKWLSAKNLYRERWMVQIDTKVSATPQNKIEVNPLRVLHRFDGGMVYQTGEHKYLLTENVFGEYPFLLIFKLSEKEFAIDSTPFYSAPESLLRTIGPICEKIAATAKLPESLHNVEVDITHTLTNYIQLPKSVELTKAIMKFGIRGVEVACDCDVDGPCGYCCDTCDCNNVSVSDIKIKPLEIVLREK